MCKVKSKKTRVNITVDSILLEQAKTKLHLFGGKLSTLFNAYLQEFVSSMDKDFGADYKALNSKVKELEQRLKKVEQEGS